MRGVYDLTQEGDLSPRCTPGEGGVGFPVLRRDEVFLRQVSLPREAWVGLWESDADQTPLPEVRVLPAGAESGTPVAVAELAPSRV